MIMEGNFLAFAAGAFVGALWYLSIRALVRAILTVCSARMSKARPARIEPPEPWPKPGTSGVDARAWREEFERGVVRSKFDGDGGAA